MATQSLNLPINIPWHLIAVSPDMMLVNSCEEGTAVEWKSSLAVYAFEPNVEDLPPELCEQRITYLKVAATVTGYQPPREEVTRARKAFDHLPLEAADQLDRILREYWACYGVLLNVAVFPHPSARQESTQERIDFAEVAVDPPVPNPLVIERPSVTFQFNGLLQSENRLVDRFPQGGDGRLELNLPRDMEITFQHADDRRVTAIEATVIHLISFAGVTLTAFRGTDEVGRQTSGLEEGIEHKLVIEADGIDRVILRHPNSDHHASLLTFACVSTRRLPTEVQDYPHIISFEPRTRDLYQSATESGEILTASASNVKTDKSMTHTQTSESGISVEALTKAGNEASPYSAQIKGGYSHTWGETSQDTINVQVDSSREKRETQGTTTNLSQMYNLLTGYHAGTNRAVFLMLPRPHVLPPTDRRTFIQGLRYIEGMQEFFLVVSRPRHIEGLRIEACLDTGHFPEDVEVIEPPVQYRRISRELPGYRRIEGRRSEDDRGLHNLEVRDRVRLGD